MDFIQPDPVLGNELPLFSKCNHRLSLGKPGKAPPRHLALGDFYTEDVSSNILDLRSTDVSAVSFQKNLIDCTKKFSKNFLMKIVVP